METFDTTDEFAKEESTLFEAEERLISPLEARLMALSKSERELLRYDALELAAELDDVIHALNSIEAHLSPEHQDQYHLF